MTDDQLLIITRWHADCDHIDALVNSCPDMNDRELLLQWYDEIHGWLVRLGNATAEAETLYSVVFSEYLDKIPAESWVRVKNSSTVTGSYIAGKNPEAFKIWKRLENLSKNLKTILDDMRTHLVNLRESDRRDGMTAKDQGKDERKNDYLFPRTEY